MGRTRLFRYVTAGAWLLALAACTFAVSARAEPEDAVSLFAFAEAEDLAENYAAALDAYERAVRLAPSAPFVPRARARADSLRSHAEGHFAPLRVLERVRRDPAAASDPEKLAELSQKADAFPPGLVRGEARLLVAEAYAGRLHRPRAAPPLLRAIVTDPAADPLTARLALDLLVAVHLDQGDLDAAANEIAAHRNLAEPSLVARVSVLVRRRALRFASFVYLAVIATVALVSIAQAARKGRLATIFGTTRRWLPFALGLLAYIGLAGAAIASAYEGGTGTPFVALAAASLPIAVVARAWGAAGRSTFAARTGRAVAAAVAVLAVAFLVLDRISADFLRGFGL